MNDFETVRACVEGAARLGVEPFIDGPAALDRIEAEVERLRAALEDIVRFSDEVPHGFEAHDLQAIARAALAKEDA